MKKLGIYAGIGFPQSLEERLVLIKAAGFDVVCLNFEQGMKATEGEWEAQLRLAQKHHLPIHAVHLTGAGMNSIWTDGLKAEAVTERTIEELKKLKALGLTLGVAHITWGLTPPQKPSLSALRRFERIADAAEQYGVQLALENSAFGEPVHYILKHIQSPNIGFCYDSGHENAFTPNEDYLTVYADRLLEMHLHDNDGTADSHQVPLFAQGMIDWEKKMQMIKKTKLGSSVVILEAIGHGERIEEFLTISYQAALKLANI